MKVPRTLNTTTYEIACILSNELEIPYVEIQLILEKTIETITKSLKKGKSVELTNFIKLKPAISSYGNNIIKAVIADKYKMQFRDNDKGGK